MENLIEFLSLSDPNVRYVVLGMVLLGICSGVVGSFTFLRKRALLGDAIAHSVLPGVCLAFMIGGTKNPLFLLVGATITGWLSLIVIDFISNRSRIKPDAAIGLVLSVFFGVGILLLTSIQGSGNAAQSGLDKFLFGKAASLIGSDVWVFGILCAVMTLVVILFFKEFKLLSFDPDFAHSIGLPIRLLEIVLATITVLTVAVGIQAVGVVLMSAMLITPAAAARYWTDKLFKMVILAAIFGAISGILGAYVSYTETAMPTGPWVIVVLSLIAFFSMLVAPKRGVWAQYVIQKRNQNKIHQENVLKLFYHIAEKGDQQFRAARSLDELLSRREFPTSILKRTLTALTKKELLDKVGNNQWKLTDEGEERGKRVVRLHRLWEVYLTKYLRIAPDHVHDDAEAMEHVITPELEAELDKLLDYPATDPHDSKIPR